MKRASFIIRLIISAGLVYFLVARIDLRLIAATISRITVQFIIVLLFISFIMLTISCLKWNLFLKARSINISTSNLILYYLIGLFFNNILPSSIGGDLFRGYLLGRDTESHSESFSSVFLERLTGLVALLTIGVISLVFNDDLLHNGVILTSTCVMFFMLAAIVLFFFNMRFKNILSTSFSNGGPFKKIKAMFDQFHESVYFFRNQWKILNYSMLYSFSFQLMTIVNTMVCCWAIGISPSVLDVAVTVPIIMLVSIIPVSINSIGLWEASFVYFFFYIGIPPAEAVSVALILRAKNLLLSLIGGIVFLLKGKCLLVPQGSC